MKRRVGLVLLVCCGMLRLGCGLSCYKCSDYAGRCENVHQCTNEDACISLSEKGGKTIRQCIRYTDCNAARLLQMFPSVADFTFRCCTSNLCNSGNGISMSAFVVALLAALLTAWWI